jgi:hypothetical protein
MITRSPAKAGAQSCALSWAPGFAGEQGRRA